MKRSSTFQPNPYDALTLTLECPVGRLTCERFPFGEVAVSQKPDGSVLVDADVESAVLRLVCDASRVSARINGAEGLVSSAGPGIWTIGRK